LTAPLPGPDPCGPNLEYDPDFLALERAERGRPEQVSGNAVKAGEAPNWNDVKERAQSLLGRSRDLRVAMSWVRASLHTEGFAGLASGLHVIRRLLEDRWETVHPQLDAEDHDDPTSRINSLVGLASSDGLLKVLRETPVVASIAVGRFSLRDIRFASGKQPVPADLEDPPQQVQIDAAFKDAKLPALEETAAAVSAALGDLRAIDRLLVDKVGAAAPDLEPLTTDLTDLDELLTAKLRARGVRSAVAAGAAEAAEISATGIARVAATASMDGGEVASREDVVRQLDRICDYYRRCEPSSPLPLLLQRAKRLVAKDFMTILRDLAPSGVAEAESIGGVEKDND
jgi:type VI secretion system protein ImpA